MYVGGCWSLFVVCSIEMSTHQPDIVSFVILKVIVACCHLLNFLLYRMVTGGCSGL